MKSSASAHHLHIHTSERSTQAQTRWAAGSVETLGQGKSAAWEEHKVYMDEWMATAQRDGEVKKRRRERKEKSKRDVTFMAGKNSCCVKITVCSYCVCLCVYEWGGGVWYRAEVRKRGQRQTWRHGDFSLVRCWQLDGWYGSAAFCGAALL